MAYTVHGSAIQACSPDRLGEGRRTSGIQSINPAVRSISWTVLKRIL